jgi:hypothetical protein
VQELQLAFPLVRANEKRVSPSRRSADYCTAHSLKLIFHALCDTVDETAFGFLVPAASYPAGQGRVWQRYQILHNLSALLKRKEDDSMARPHHALDKIPLQTFEPLSTTCLACGRPAHIAYHTQRTITALDGQHRLHLAVRRCISPDCPRYHLPYRPEAERARALPHGEYGLDVIALVGFLRYRRHQSLPEIHRSLHERGLTIGERTVLNLLARYEELVTLHMTDHERLQSLVRKQGHLILAVDGLKPDVGHEVLWVVRDCVSSEILLARPLLSERESDLVTLFKEVQDALSVPIHGVVSDGQHSIRNAVATALPGIPHQLCQSVVSISLSP